MKAVERCDQIEDVLTRRIAYIYTDALKKALGRKKSFFKQLADVDSGKIKPPQYYIDTDKVDQWRHIFVRQLIRQANLIDSIMEELNRAGLDAAKLIQDTMPQYYAIHHAEAIDQLRVAMRGNGHDGTLFEMTKRQVKIITADSQPVFAKIAYENMGQNLQIRRRLQNELAQAAVLGESQIKLVYRIRSVTKQAIWQARRIAQTERTRVQSQARFEAGAQAMALGVPVINRWSTRMVNSRDTHIALDGKVALHGELFPGSMLRYPGDPSAPAHEVINCRCVLVPGVLLDGQMVIDGKVVG